MALVEDRRSLFFVQSQDRARRKTKAKSDGDDAASGGPGDQIEIRSDWSLHVLFQLGEEGGRKDTTNSAPVEGEYFIGARAVLIAANGHAKAPLE